MYVGPGSIYVDGQKVLQTDISDSVVVSADVNQNLILKTSGSGHIELNPSGEGQILLKSDLNITGGKAIRTSNSTPVLLSDGVSTPSINTSVLNGGISIAPNGTGNTYVTANNFGIRNTAPGELLSIGTPGTTAGTMSLAGGTSGKAIIQTSPEAGTPTLTLPTTTGTLALISDISAQSYPSSGIAVSTGSAWGTSIADNSADWNTAYTNRITSLTTSGSSGAGTLISNTLNIPNYTLAGLGGQPLLTNPVTGTGTVGFLPKFTTTGSTIGDSQIYDNGASVGIGTGGSTPSQKLDVFGAIALNGTKIISLPDQSTLLGSLIYGTGGTSLSYVSGNNGRYNTLIGIDAGKNLGIGNSNTALGYKAGYSSNTGATWTALGYMSGYSSTTGKWWTATGYQAGYSSTTGNDWTANGYMAGYSNSSGSGWTATGYGAGLSNKTGSNWVADGYKAGRFLANGTTNAETFDNSTYIGANTKVSANGVTNENVFGYDAIGIGSDSVTLGNDLVTTTALKGNVGIGTTIPTAKLHIGIGTTAPGGAPLKLTAGTNLGAIEAGAVEYDGTDLFFTPSTTRETIAFISDITGAAHNPVTINPTTPNGLSLATQVLSLGLASSGVTGALSGTDWATFSGKQDALSGTGFVKSTAGVISYDTNTYQPLATNLSSIGSLANASGALMNNGSGTFSYSTPWTGLGYLTGIIADSPLTGSGTSASHLSIPAATASVNGYMTSTYATKLDGIATGATANAKITGATLDALTDDTGFVTALAIQNGHNVPHAVPSTSGNLLQSNGTDWASVAVPTWNQNTNGTAAGLSTILVSTSGGSGLSNSGTLNWGAGGTLGTAAYTASGAYMATPSGTLNYVSKFTGTGTTIGNSSIFDNGTNVGIGTTTPNGKLSVINSADISWATTGNAVGNLIVGTNLSSGLAMGSIRGTGATGYTWLQAQILDAAQLSNDLILQPMSGNVGIGTTAPGYKLDVVGAGNGFGGTSYFNSHFVQDQTTFRGIALGYDTGGQTGLIAADSAGTASNIAFWTYNSGFTEKMRILGNGNVGIGTTGPTALLEVNNNGGTLTKNLVTIKGGGDSGNYNALSVQSYLGGELFTVNGLNYNVTMATVAGNVGIGYADPGTAKLAINGNVGIGTTGPLSALTVAGTDGITWGAGSESSSRGLVTIGNSYNGGSLFVRTPSLNTHVHQSGLGITGSFAGYKSIININAYGVFSGSYGSDMAFSTTESGTLNEWMRITNTGNVGIGTTGPVAKLQIGTAADVLSNPNGLSIVGGDLNIDNGAGATDNQIYFRYQSVVSTIQSDKALRFNTHNAEAMRILENGNVGIGTTNPGAKLDVGAATSPTSNAIFRDRNGTVGVEVDQYGTLVAHSSIGNLNGIFYTLTDGTPFTFLEGGSEKMRISNTGNVGIGTTNPTSLFDVAGRLHVTASGASPSGGQGLEFYGGASPEILAYNRDTPGYLNLNLSDKVMILSTGNVGIGTTDPGAKLEVNGAASILGTSNGAAVLTLGTSGAINAVINTADEMYFNIDSNDNQTEAGFHFGHNAGTSSSTQLMTIKDNGNVGIGTTSPTGKFGVLTNTQAQVSFNSLAYNTPTIDFVDASGGGEYGAITAYDLTFKAGGVDTMFLQHGGNVGIGTTDPGTYKLNVAGEFLASGSISSIGGNAGVFWKDRSTSNPWGWYSSGDKTYMYNGTLGTTPIVVDYTSGNVGIGTTSPVEKLSVSGGAYIASFIGTTTPYITVGTAASGADNRLEMVYNAAGNYGALQISGDTAGSSLVIANAGNVGIGTATPSKTLTIKKDVANGIGASLYLQNNQYNDSVGSGTEIIFGSYSGTSDPFRYGRIYTYGGGSGTVERMSFGTSINGTAGFTDHLSILATGNVGIGTTVPQNKLSVTNNNVSTVAIDLRADDATLNNADFSLARILGTHTTTTYTGARLDLQTATGENTWLTGLSVINGNVGIGTTEPTAKLDVGSSDLNPPASSGTTNTGLMRVGYSNRTWDGTELNMGIINSSASNYAFWFQAQNPADLSINRPILLNPNGGNVGIGTTVPNDKLELGSGNIRLSGTDGYLTNYFGVNQRSRIGYSEVTGALEFTNYLGGGYLTFAPASGTERMRISANGNVGIGTTNPEKLLHVAGDSTFGNAVAGTNVNMIFNGVVSKAARIKFQQSGVDQWLIGNGSANETNNFELYNASGTIALSVDKTTSISTFGAGVNIPTGNVGIGTTNPLGKLHVDGSASSFLVRSTGAVSMGYGDTGTGQLIVNGNVGINTTDPTALLDIKTPSGFARGLRIGPQNTNINDGAYIEFTSAVADNYGAQIGGIRTGSSGENALVFKTGTNSQAEQMRITNAGNVLIGTAVDMKVASRLQVKAPSGSSYLAMFANNDFVTNTSGSGLVITTGATSGETYTQLNSFGLGYGSNQNLVLNSTGGNVGIGTNAPGKKLEVNGVVLVNQTAVGGDVWSEGLRINRATVPTQYGVIAQLGGAMQFTSIVEGGGEAGTIIFNRHNAGSGTVSESMRIDGTGAVGIGTTDTSLAKLTVDGNALLRTDTIDARFITFQNSGAEFVVGVDSSSGNYIAGGEPYASILASGGTNPIQFGVNDSIVMTLRDGAVEVTGPVHPIDTNTYNLGASGRNWGCLYYNSGTLGTCASDERLKTNISDVNFGTTDALTQIAGLRPRTFSFISDSSNSIYNGLIAQEVEEFAPNLVVTGDDGYKSVKYGELQWLTLEGIQEMNLNLNGIAGISTIPASEKEVEDTTTDEDGIITTVYTDGSIDVTYLDGTIITTPAPESPEGKYQKKFFANVFLKVGEWLGSASNGVKKIFAKTVVTEAIEMKDTYTGEPYCILVTNGELNKIQGTCDEVAPNANVKISDLLGSAGSSSLVDSIPPIITLIGESTVTLVIGDTYVEQGATATDDIDTSLSVLITGEVDTTKDSTNIIHYNVSDIAGNNAVEMTRTVIVGSGSVISEGENIEGDTVVNQDAPIEPDPTPIETQEEIPAEIPAETIEEIPAEIPAETIEETPTEEITTETPA